MALPFFCKKFLARTRLARMFPGLRRRLDGGVDYLHYYSDQLLAAPLDDLLDEGAFPEAHGPDSVHLAMPAPRAVRLPNVRTGVERRGSANPWGMAELRTEIAESRYDLLGHRINPTDEVLITHGATGAFRTVIDSFVNPGSRAVLFDPCSPIFSLGLKHRRAKIRRVPTWIEDGRTRFHMRPFVRAMKGARLLVLTDPANPTGGTLSPEDLEQIAWWANHYDVLIYLDESFSAFRYEGGEGNALPTLPYAEKRTLCAGSVSKSHGLPGLRVGWLTGNRHLTRACALTSTLTDPFVPVPCQQTALAALGIEPTSKDEFAQKRRYTHDRLRAMGLTPEWPAGGFFFWVPVSGLGVTGRDFGKLLFRAKKVLVNPGDVYGPSGTGYVRLSYATEEGRLREGLNRLADFVAELRTLPEPATAEHEPAERGDLAVA